VLIDSFPKFKTLWGAVKQLFVKTDWWQIIDDL
jgi:hypothetical protein